MKSYKEELHICTSRRREYVNITPKVEAALRKSGINESGLHHDFERFLEKVAPEKPHSYYEHNGYEDNGDAHIKRQIMGREVVVAVTDGRLDFGPWEQIFYGEFDGMRDKRIMIKIIGE